MGLRFWLGFGRWHGLCCVPAEQKGPSLNTSPQRAFDPWIGEHYAQGFNGPRIFILGESQYDSSETEPRPGVEADRHTTQDIVLDLALKRRGPLGIRYRQSALFTKVTKLFRGREQALTDEAKADFWHRVTFYNYVQWWLTASRKRPTLEMWLEAQVPFLEVLRRLDPQLLLVLGRDLELALPPIPEHIATVCIHHPSKFGWTYEPSASRIKHAIDTLKEGSPQPT